MKKAMSLLAMVKFNKLIFKVFNLYYNNFLDPEFIKNCEGGVCTFMKKKNTNESTTTEAADNSKKDD